MPLMNPSSSLPLQILLRRMGAVDEEEDSPALDRYEQHIRAMPQRESFEPSKLERILYGLAGAGMGNRDPMKGYLASREFIERPYREGLEDWDVRGKGLRESANIERQGQATRGVNQKRLFDIQNQIEDNRRLEEDSRSLRSSRQRQGDIAEGRKGLYEQDVQSRIGDREARAGRERERLGLYGKNVGSQIKTREEKKTYAPKGQLTEQQVHKMAIENVLRDNPEWTAFIDDKGLPTGGKLNESKKIQLIGFQQLLEKEKERLRKGGRRTNDIQLGNVAAIEDDSDMDFSDVIAGDPDSAYKYLER